jgi:hypothetical protein
MYATSSLGRSLGLSFGNYLGRQIALGACRDDPDDDWERRLFVPRVGEGTLPRSVDLRAWMTPVEDQGALGSCTSNALAGALEYLVRRETGEHVDVSRLFIYFNQRLWDDSVREDVGAAVSHGVRVLAKVGAPLEQLWPYDRRLFAVQPPERVYREAARFRLKDWWSVPIDRHAIEACLAGGFPIVFGTRVTESFMNVGRTGLVPMIGARDRDDAKHGRHALLLCGYDAPRQLFVIRNSWGTDWGDGGYGYLPYDYFLNREWTRNAWALRLTDRTDFDESQRTDARQMPDAGPARGPGGGAGAGAQIAGVGTELAVGMLTGSGLLGGLVGGLVTGIAPGVVQRVRGRDGGTAVEADRTDTILQALRGEGAPPPGLAPMAWDDGLDEAAARPVATTREALSGPAPVAGTPTRGRSPAAAPAQPMRGPAPAGVTPSKPSALGANPVSASPVSASPVSASLVGASPVGSSPLVNAVGAVAAAGALVGGLGPSGAGVGPRAPVAATGAEATRAAIEQCWRDNGGAQGPYGPIQGAPNEMVEGAHRGVSARFAGGGMFAWPGAPVIAMRSTDRLLASWIARGAPRSPLGWPSGAPVASGDGRARVMPFTRGALFDVPGRDVVGLWGTLYAYWLQLGGPRSDLGSLTADLGTQESAAGPEEVARFERGVLSWSPVHGVRRA